MPAAEHAELTLGGDNQIVVFMLNPAGEAPQDISAAVEFMRQYGSKFKVVEERVNTTLAERLTLNRVKELTRPTDRIFYLHSKGAPL